MPPMLRNYAHHAQSPKSSMHIVHKIQCKAILQTLKNCHIDHLLWNRCSSLTFVRGTLTDHFHGRTINAVHMIGFVWLCAQRKPIGGSIGARIGLIGTICARDCVWPCKCADRPSQFLCMHMCTHAQNGSAENLKQTACTLFHGRYFIDTDETRFLRGTFSIVAHHLKLLCALHQKSKSCA
jgi:hypothetical protein